MSQCLRCKGPCDAAAVFCNECRATLRTSFRSASSVRAFSETDTSLPAHGTRGISAVVQDSGKVGEEGKQADERVGEEGEQPELNSVEQNTRTQRVTKAPDTPHPPVLESYADSSGQTFSLLNEAAQRIARDDSGNAAPNRRLPRPSRLAPFRDISAEIRRESTPLPKYTRQRKGTSSQEIELPDTKHNGHSPSSQRDSVEQEIQNASWPDFWPWFDGESEEKEGEDNWANRTDPLITRHRPNSVEAALIEQEDIRRALAEGIQTSQLPVRQAPRHKSPLRNIFIALAIFAIVALVIDGVLLGALSRHSHNPPTTHSSLSATSVTLFPNVVNVRNGPQSVQVHLLNFAPNARVWLTHDVQEDVQVQHAPQPGMIPVGASGSITVTMIVSSQWGPGYHLVVAEDVHTRNTASATLQVITQHTSTPAHLEVVATNGQALKRLEFGANYAGINATQSIQLTNSGTSGPITWSASSDQSWLLVSPSSGLFNRSQMIEVAVQRNTNLLPKGFVGTKEFSGSLKFFSNVGPPMQIPVTMSVTSLPPGSAVLALSPAVLSLTVTDGSTAPLWQPLTITNPGTKPFTWSVTATSSTSASTQIAIAHQLGASGNWLSASPTSGTVQGLSTAQVQVLVQTASLLPGAYLGSLVFTSNTLDSTLTLSVSLTVQPHCGLTTTTGFLSFTAVQGKASAGSQAVGLNETSSCAGGLNWTALVSTPSWLSVSPASGMLHGTASQFVAVSVNPATQTPKPQPYTGFLVFTTPMSTQTVLVQLVVQPPPPPNEPVMGASPLNLNFSSTQGQPNPNGQVVTITNNGEGTLRWKSIPIPLLGNCNWLSVSPTGGGVLPGQTGTVTINMNTSCLTPGTYAGQVTLEGADTAGKQASGSGQVVQVNLVVQPACMLTQPSLSSLSFSGVQFGSNPNLQNVLISGTGNCAWPLNISAAISPNAASWLKPISSSSIKGNGQSTSLNIGPGVRYANLTAGTYLGTITITATDSAGILAQGSPQNIGVTLTVLPPCTLAAPVPSSLTFSIAQGAATGTSQTIALSETGTCSRPISYTTNTGNASWLSATQQASDTGNGGTLAVNVSATNLQAGSYTAQINVTAVDNNGLPVSGTVTIPVTMSVTASISGTVFACTGTPGVCVAPAPLPGATVTVLNGSVTVMTVTADSSGNYVISPLPTGNYTVNVSGTDSLNVHYSATNIPLSVTGNATGVNFDAFSG